MRRTALAVLLTVTTLGLGGCAETGVSAADAYKIGCPALDSAAAGGSVAGKATVAGLKALRDSDQLGAEPQRWVESAVDLLESDDPSAASAETKKLITEGCGSNGYPLRNLG